MKKKFFIISSIVFIVIIILLGVGLAVLHYLNTRVSYNALLTAPVKSKVIINRDLKGVPQIHVNNREDMYLALGFLHGQDRYSEIEYYRVLASGQASSMIKQDGPILERLAVSIGFTGRAQELASKIGEPHAQYLKAYVAGINCSRKLRNQPDILKRDWKVEDILAILLMKEWANSFLNNHENVFQLPEEFMLDDRDKILPAQLVTTYKRDEADSVDLVRRLKRVVSQYIGSFNRGYCFFIPGVNTRTGSHFSAFSFEDMLSTYPGWYPVHVLLGGRVYKGITFAGMPFMFAGNNNEISFCGYSLDVDTQDLIIEKTRKLLDSDIMQYQSATGWKVFHSRREAVGATGISRKNYVIWETDHGPVLNNIFSSEEKLNYAITIKYVLPDSSYVISLLEIPFSKSVDDAADLVKAVQSTPRVYLFSSDAYAVVNYSGMVPIRAASGSTFIPGNLFTWEGLTDISSYEEEYPYNMAVGSSFFDEAPDEILELAVFNRKRYNRLLFLLNTKLNYSKRDIEDILQDQYSIYAEDFVPIYLSMLKDNPVTSSRLVRIYFQNWRYTMEPGEVSPSIFTMLTQKFIYETFSDDFKEHIDHIMENYHLMIPLFYQRVIEDNPGAFDDRSTYDVETREAIFDRSFLKTMRFFNRRNGPRMDEWQWGDIHSGYFTIPRVPRTVSSLFRGDVEPEPFSGSFSTLLHSSLKLDLKPKSSTSLSGYIGKESSHIYMNYSYSLNPGSEFYYGETQNPGKLDFHKISGEFETALIPAQ